MDREDQRRYLVVGSVILEVVTPLFQRKIENDFTTSGFGSLQAFINSQQVIHTLFHLRHRNSWCCKDKPNCRNPSALPLVYCQWNKLYSENPGPGIHNCHCKFTANPVQLNELDISLSSLILLNCCNLSQSEEEAVQLLRQYKNDYLSHNTTGCITQTEYNTLWADLVTYVLRLDPSKQDDIIRIENRPLDESLCKKYFTFLLDLHQQIEEIKSTMENVHSSIQTVSSSLSEMKSSVQPTVQGMDTTVQGMNTTVHRMETAVRGMGNSIQGIETSVQQTNNRLNELLQKGLTCECRRQIIVPLCKPLEEKACVILRSYSMLYKEMIDIPLLPHLIANGVMSLKMQRYVLQPKTHDQRISRLLSILVTRANGFEALLSALDLSDQSHVSDYLRKTLEGQTGETLTQPAEPCTENDGAGKIIEPCILRSKRAPSCESLDSDSSNGPAYGILMKIQDIITKAVSPEHP